MHRRRFLHNVAAGAAVLRLPPSGPEFTVDPAARRLRVLVLGGSNFVGPHLVWAALERGHEVTLFNRGFTNPDLFPHLERLKGNRFPERGIGLSALAGSRSWDLVLDTWHSEPGCVHESAELLADRAERYVYVSSIAILGSYRQAELDEQAPTVDAAALVTSMDPDVGYAQRKRAAELAVMDRYGSRGTVLRCHTVYGYDAGAVQLDYWALRFLSGEPVLVPDDATAVLQWTDARDIGRFAVHAAETELGGIFHLINPAQPVPIQEYFTAWHDVTGRRSQIVRAPRAFLDDRGVRPWDDLRLYIPDDDPEPGFFRVDATRAHATGFAFRSLRETLADTARTFTTAPAPELTAGLSRRRELELIWELTGSGREG